MAFNKETAAKAGSLSSRKGTPNKETKALRERITALLDNRWEQFLKDLDKLSEKERVDTIIRMLEYALPKLNRTEVRELTSLEDFVALSPKERQQKIMELKKQINDE